MLYFSKKFCKKIFRFIGATRLKVVRSSGLVLIKDFLAGSGLIELLHRHITDNRDPFRIKYLGQEMLLGIILGIMDGSIRLSHQKNTHSKSFYEELYTNLQVPHFTTLRYFFETNPNEYKALKEIVFCWTLQDLQKKIEKKKLKRITIDIDQTARAVYGKQKKANKGYSATHRGNKLFQIEIWSIRELKTILKIDLKDGKDYCGKNILARFQLMIPQLKVLNIPITVVCDSGYENKEVFAYLESMGVKFLFARKQRKEVKVRGKNAKNKTITMNLKQEETIMKEGISPPIEYEGYAYSFREIFVQHRIIIDEHGQQYLKEFDSNEFTNVFVTNLDMKKEIVYEFYKKHAQVETIIEELKNDFGLGLAHNNDFNINQSMAQIATLAYNAKNMFVSENLSEQFSDKLVKLSTLQRDFIHIPGILVNDSGKKILKLTVEGLSILKNHFLNFGYQLAL